MGGTCFHCGKPLGTAATLCYECESEGIDPETVVDVDDGVLDRVERYFIVSATKCANCEELHTTVTADGETYTAADFAIDSIDEWRLEMEKEEQWLRENRSRVEPALVMLEAEWPESVAAVRSHVLR